MVGTVLARLYLDIEHLKHASDPLVSYFVKLQTNCTQTLTVPFCGAKLFNHNKWVSISVIVQDLDSTTISELAVQEKKPSSPGKQIIVVLPNDLNFYSPDPTNIGVGTI